METYNARSLRIKYRSQGVQTSFYESTPSPSKPLGDQITPGSRGNSRHAGTNQPHASKECDNRGTSRFTRVLLEHVPGSKSFRRVATCDRSKESEQSHERVTFPYVQYKLCSKLRSKRRLRVQDRSAGCVLSRTYPFLQQKVPQVCLREQGIPVSSTTFRSKYRPSDFYSIGAHGDRLSSPPRDIVHTISRRLVNSPSGPTGSTSTSGLAFKHSGPSRFHLKQKEIRTGPVSGPPVSRNSFTSGLRGSFPSRLQSSGDSYTRTPSILPSSTILHSNVPPYGFTQLGLRSYPPGSFVPETPSTSFSLLRSDKPVYATALIRPTGPCQPSAALAGPTFSYLRNPNPHVSGGFYDFHRRIHAGMGCPHGDSQISGTWTRMDRRLHINCLELKAIVSALKHWAPVLQGHQVMVATDNSTVVSYINKQGGTRSPTLLCLTVELLLWLEAQNIIVQARHIPGCLNMIADHLSRLNQPISTEWSLHPEIVERIFHFWGRPEVDMLATVSNSHLPQFMSPIPEPRALAVDALSQDWQGRAMYMFPLFPLLNKVIQKLRSTQAAEVILIAPWWPNQSWFPHLLRLCVEHPLVFPYCRDLLSQQDQKYVSEGKSCHLHAWRLSCDTTKQQAFQTSSLGSRQPLGDPPPIACTTIDGFASFDGPQGKGLIRLTPRLLRQPPFCLLFLILMACHPRL